MLKSCCCGVPLKKGALIIGILSAIASAISCITWTVVLIIMAVNLSQSDTEPEIVFIVSISFNILTGLAQLIIAIILVRGVRQEAPKKVRLFLTSGTVAIVISLASTSVSAVVAATGLALSVVIGLVVQAYFLLVIWSYYKELLAEGADGGEVIVTTTPPSPAPSRDDKFRSID